MDRSEGVYKTMYRASLPPTQIIPRLFNEQGATWHRSHVLSGAARRRGAPAPGGKPLLERVPKAPTTVMANQRLLLYGHA